MPIIIYVVGGSYFETDRAGVHTTQVNFQNQFGCDVSKWLGR